MASLSGKIVKQINNYSFDSPMSRTVSLDNSGIIQLSTLIDTPKFWDSLSSLFKSPTDFMSSIFWYPFNTHGTNSRGKLIVGQYDESGVSAYETYSYGPLLNMGKFKVPLNRNNYWSYNGFSQLQAMLPLCGMVDIPINDVLSVAGSNYNQDIYLYFRMGVDYRTGQGVYYIFASTDDIETMNPIYSGRTINLSEASSDFTFNLMSRTASNIGCLSLKNIDVEYVVDNETYYASANLTEIGQEKNWSNGSSHLVIPVGDLNLVINGSTDSAIYRAIISNDGNEYEDGRLLLYKSGISDIILSGGIGYELKSVDFSYDYKYAGREYDIILGYGENQYATKDYLYDNLVLVGTYQCQVGYPIPIPTSNTTDIYRNLLMGAVKSTVGVLGTIGAMSTPSSSYGNTTTTTYSSTTYGRSKSKGSRMKKIEETSSTKTKVESGVEPRERVIKNKAMSTLDTAVTTLSSLYSSGNIERISNSSMFGYLTENIVVYLRTPIFNTLSFINPTESSKRNAKIFGLPYGQTVALNEVHGYTTVSEVHLDNTPAGITSEEREMIDNLLGAGVFLP